MTVLSDEEDKLAKPTPGQLAFQTALRISKATSMRLPAPLVDNLDSGFDLLELLQRLE